MKPKHHPDFQHLNFKCKHAGMGRSQMAPEMTGWSRDIPSFTLSRSTVWNRLKKNYQSPCCPQQLAAFLMSNRQYRGWTEMTSTSSLCQGGMYRCGTLAWQNPTPLFCSQKSAYTKVSFAPILKASRQKNRRELLFQEGSKNSSAPYPGNTILLKCFPNSSTQHPRQMKGLFN